MNQKESVPLWPTSPIFSLIGAVNASRKIRVVLMSSPLVFLVASTVDVWVFGHSGRLNSSDCHKQTGSKAHCHNDKNGNGYASKGENITKTCSEADASSCNETTRPLTNTLPNPSPTPTPNPTPTNPGTTATPPVYLTSVNLENGYEVIVRSVDNLCPNKDYLRLNHGLGGRAKDWRREIARLNNQSAVTGNYVGFYTGRHDRPLAKNSKRSVWVFEHLVSLKDAWISGICSRDNDNFLKDYGALANDSMNVVLANHNFNQKKSDKGFAKVVKLLKEYHKQFHSDPRPYICKYWKRYVGVKSRYGLSVTENDKNSLWVWRSCGAE